MSGGKGALMRTGVVLALGCLALLSVTPTRTRVFVEAEAALPRPPVGHLEQRVWSRPAVPEHLLLIGDDYPLEVVRPRWVF